MTPIARHPSPADNRVGRVIGNITTPITLPSRASVPRRQGDRAELSQTGSRTGSPQRVSRRPPVGVPGMAVPEETAWGVDDFRSTRPRRGDRDRRDHVPAGLSLHNDTCLSTSWPSPTRSRSQRWLPGIASGELITAVAMTEPGAIRPRRLRTRQRDGDHYLVNGRNLHHHDQRRLVINPGEDRERGGDRARSQAPVVGRRAGMSLLISSGACTGRTRPEPVEAGLRSQTPPSSRSATWRPVENLLGEEGDGSPSSTQN